jgi:hypothetical protein
VDYVDYTVTGSGGYGRGQAAGYRVGRSAAAVSRDAVGQKRQAPGHRYAFGRANAGGGSYYVVRPGATMWEISAQLGTTVQRLASANGIANHDVISVGQRIRY